MTSSLVPPRLKPEWVRREKAIAKMRKSVLDKKHIFVSAPGGYGKTIAVIQFMENVGMSKAWIKIEKTDAAFFYERLLTALTLIVPSKELRSAVKKYNGEYNLAAVLKILAALPLKGRRCYLIIDDLHMAGAEIKQALPTIIKHLPTRYITLGMISREGVLPFEEPFTLISKKDLAFSTEEGAHLWEHIEKQSTFPSIEELIKTTDGWIMGIQILLLGNILPGQLVSSSGDMLNSYIRDHIWTNWDEDTCSLLLKLAFLPEVSPEMVSYLTDGAAGQMELENLCENNVFLNRIDENTYRFHDLFRDFLVKQAANVLPMAELAQIRKKAAYCLFRQGEYLNAAMLYIANENHQGIDRCITESSRQKNNVSIDSFIHFIQEVILPLPEKMLTENYNLLIERAWCAFLTGDSKTFVRDMGIIFENQQAIVATAPETMEKVIFMGALFFPMPLKNFAQQGAEMLKDVPQEALHGEREVNSSAITHNLPFFHRSMRDFSEYYDMEENAYAILRKSFGKMIGKDYLTMELCLIGGLHYEKNELTKAAELAFKAYGDLGKNTHYETVFCANMLLCAVLETMGAQKQIDKIYGDMYEYIKKAPANVLSSNLAAMNLRRKLRKDKVKYKPATRAWLEAHPVEMTEHLSFYRLGWHFATLESDIFLEEYGKAIDFAKRLVQFGVNYQRPLDEIEAKILLATAYSKAGERVQALKAMKQALKLAEPFGFSRPFINYGNEIYPLLQGELKVKSLSLKSRNFMGIISESISHEYDVQPVAKIKLSRRRQNMLEYIAENLTYGEIAEKTGLAYGTVKNHIRLLYKDLEANNAEEAVQKGKMLGLLEKR